MATPKTHSRSIDSCIDVVEEDISSTKNATTWVYSSVDLIPKLVQTVVWIR